MNAQIIEGLGVLMAISNSGRTAYGFSDVTGEWAKIAIEGVSLAGKAC